MNAKQRKAKLKQRQYHAKQNVDWQAPVKESPLQEHSEVSESWLMGTDPVPRKTLNLKFLMWYGISVIVLMAIFHLWLWFKK